ncbi:hypothetical protein PV327_001758 [Microctonus hyperodae]|uniref:Aminopeptidase n=1 Tax=Microctonus hyperodae TaxID=165561 RepID=A0AA39KNC9_MICHY|nr:hypothetical protein PV327_001758 [Microctonus hyperodae]
MATMPLNQPQTDGQDDQRPVHFFAKSIMENRKKQFEYRLPSNTAPRVYIIELDPDFLGEKFTFNGNGTIIFEVLRPTFTVTLHRSDKMDIDNQATELIDESGSVKKPISQDWNSANNFFSIKFKSKLNVGNYSLKMSWTGRDGNDDWFSPQSGFYRAVDKDENDNPKYLVTTHFEPTGARRVFPCWDEPGMKAQFEISIKHYPNYTALSNMPVKTREELSNGKILTKFERSPKMSSYLPCLAVADYKYVANAHGNITFYTLERALDSVKYALEVSEKVIPAMEFYTDVPYAFPKLDQITIPQYSATAMEHWGLVSYVTSSVLIQNTSLLPDITEKQNIEILIAHELSHQWFGNLITPIWWNDAWLNEAFAAYFQYKALELVYPERHIMSDFVVDHLNRLSFKAENTLRIARPIKWNPINKIQIFQMFSQVTYAKGAGVLHMLDHMLGEDVFRDGIRRYMKAHQFTAVITDDLWDDLQEAYDEKNKDKPLNVKETMDPWIEQTGHPIVTVTRNYETGEVILTQKNAMPTNPNNKWKIPLNYATKSNPDFSSTLPTMWFDKDKDNVTIPNVNKDDWIILNIQQRGFYWVDYDEENWHRIADYLDSDDYQKISPINRAQLIIDSYRMFKRAKVDTIKRLEILINIMSYLYREVDHLPWIPAQEIILYFTELMRNTPDEEISSKYMLFLMANILDDIDEDYAESETKQLLLPTACKLEHAECLKFARSVFDKFLESPTTEKFFHHDNFWIMCAGLQNANETVWDSLIELIDSKRKYYSPYEFLGCSDSEEIRNKYMDEILTTNKTEDPYELLRIFNTFLNSNRDNEHHDPDYMTVMFAALNMAIKNRDQYEKFKAFFEPRLEGLKETYNEPDMETMLKDVENEVEAVEERSAQFHNLMDKRLFGPNAIKNDENITKSQKK